MDKDELKQSILEVLEVQLESQLRAIRQMQGKQDALKSPSPRQGRRRQSIVDLSINIITDEARPLHVNEIVQMLQQRFGRVVDRDTLSSALGKKVRNKLLLRQPAPATFALIESKERKHVKT
jgi:hypothetical protein